MLLPLVVLAAIALFSLQSVTNAIDDVAQEATEEMATVLHLQILMQRAMIVAHDCLAHGHDDPGTRERFMRAGQRVDKAFEGIGAGAFALAEEQALIRFAQEEWGRGRQLGEGILARSSSLGGWSRGGEIDRLQTHVNRALEMLDRMHNLAEREMSDQSAYASALRRRVFLGIATVFVVGLGAAIAVGTALARSIMTPLRALESGVDRFGAGDLSYRMSLTGQDEFGQLGRTFNAMADKLEQSQATLREQSTHDDLTGLFNYREFNRQLTEEVERSRRYTRPFSLLMLDIDHFKVVNDTYGHMAGDEALQALATLIRREIRPVDLVARYGGEEFVMLLPETTGPGALELGERLRAFIAGHAVPLSTGHTIFLTVSIGLATYPDDADSLPRLVNLADQALYAAKSAGRNRVNRWGMA